ncbi:MAG TPA: hypothetical protein PKD73_13970 [Burkholderiaceae bacterium]|nr:hypothetical protein [Burkholderiaceae bacterium]
MVILIEESALFAVKIGLLAEIFVEASTENVAISTKMLFAEVGAGILGHFSESFWL